MDFDGVMSIECDAEESDWLDVSYSERNYVDQPATKPKRAKVIVKRSAKIAIFAVLAVAVLAALLFADGQFTKDVFQTAKAAYSATVFGSPQPQEAAKAAVAIPSNIDLVDVTDGVATFGGGRAALAFAAGSVTAVEENSVTVSLDENTSVVYGNLTDIFVGVGDAVSANSLLAKYDGTFTVTVTVGEAAAEVSQNGMQLTWNV